MSDDQSETREGDQIVTERGIAPGQYVPPPPPPPPVNNGGIGIAAVEVAEPAPDSSPELPSAADGPS
jgi:hypothetical protein